MWNQISCFEAKKDSESSFEDGKTVGYVISELTGSDCIATVVPSHFIRDTI